MQLTNYYLQLRTSFSQNAEGKPQRVTLEELAALLFCTTRNVKLLLKRMAELHWITWEPGRGRGNASELTFHVPAGEMISKEAVELVQKGDFKGAIGLINEYGYRYPLKESFVEWLFGYFGYKAEEQGERRLDLLRFPLYRQFDTLDPIHAYFASDVHIIDNVFDTLVTFNTATKKIEPRLAHYWETNDDRTEWTFYLRKGVLFHHGREMTAYDVKYSLERLADPANGSSHAWIVEGIRDIVVLNRSTVRVELSRTNYLFLRHVSENCTSIVPEDVCRENAELLARLPIGTGAFRVDYHDDYICRLQAFGSYYGQRPYLDQVELWVLPEELPGNRINMNSHVVPYYCDYTGMMKLDRLVPDGSEWNKRVDIVPGCSLLTFNLQAPGPQRHAKFREAVDLLIDRESMVRELGGNRLRPAAGFLHLYDESGETEPYVTDVERARQLLDEIGYDGEPLRVYTYKLNPEDVYWIRDRCALAGIRLEVCVLDRSELNKPQSVAEANMIYYAVVLEVLDFTVLGTLLQKKSFLAAHLSTDMKRRVQEDIIRMQQLPDKAERHRSMQELERKLKESRALLFLVQNSHALAYHESLKGVTLNALGWVDFRKLFFTGTETPIEALRKS